MDLISTQHPYCSPLSFQKVQEREELSLPSLFLYLSLSFQASLMGPLCSVETRFLKVANVFPTSRLSVSCLTFILLSLLMTFDEMAKSYVSKFHAFTLNGQSSSFIIVQSPSPFPYLFNVGFSIPKLLLMKHIQSHGLKCYFHSDQVYISNSHIFLSAVTLSKHLS